MNDERKNKIIRLGNSLKASNINKNNIFEGLNIRYFGPIDGHDIQGLVHKLEKIKRFEGPKVLHCITVKGKGYKSAEDSATVWHAPGIFNKETGEVILLGETKHCFTDKNLKPINLKKHEPHFSEKYEKLLNKN